MPIIKSLTHWSGFFFAVVLKKGMHVSPIADCLSFAWNKNAAYGQDLISDLSDEQLVAQPTVARMNHAAWVFSHLNAYLPVVRALVEELPFDDPEHHPYGMHSHPVGTGYASQRQLLDQFVNGHAGVSELLEGKSEHFFTQAVPLPRWRDRMPTMGILLGHLMARHESTHLGQVSAWRRSLGLPAV